MQHSPSPPSDYLRSWYSTCVNPEQVKNYASPVAQQAFQEAVKRFASDMTSDAGKINIAMTATRMEDIQALLRDSFAKYSDERKHPTARKWLQRAVSKIHHYGNILDVFVQHHPEYVALAWGSIKLLLVSAQNHENTICLLSKALSQIASSLPRVELAVILYPTERMRVAVGNLYANLIRFFIRAHEWCSEGSLRHMIHSITRPVELRYKDLLADIADDAREIDQLAVWGSHVETREINLKLTDIATKLDSYHVLHSSSLLDTNQRLSDLQFSQIMSHVSMGKLGDPLGSYRFNQSIQRRRSRSGGLETTNKFWQSPKLTNWSSIQKSKVVIMSGNFRARFAMRNFSLEIIQQLRSQHIPVLWVLPGPKGDKSEATGVSAIDLFKSLIHQVLQLEKDVMTESGMALQCAQFHRSTTEQEWLQLLGSALLRARSQVYMVLDLSILDRTLQHPDGFSWLAAFQQLFTEIAKRSSNLQVKVLLLCDGPGQWMQNGQRASPDVVVPVKVTQTTVRRKKRGPDPPMRFTIRPSGSSRGS